MPLDFDWPLNKVWGGFINPHERTNAEADVWTATEPPAGEGWQMWETVSEGSPVTPVFPTPEALVEHMVRVMKYPRDGAEAFVAAGWAPSLVVENGVVRDGVAASAPSQAEPAP